MLKAFIVGSSIINTIISFSYIGNAFKSSGRPSSFPYEIIPIGISVIFGIANILNIYLQSKYTSRFIPFIVGGLMGILFSVVGRFVYGLPQKIFGFNESNEYQVHLVAFVLYGLIFQFIVQYVNQIFEL
jgi:hypothetical protein